MDCDLFFMLMLMISLLVGILVGSGRWISWAGERGSGGFRGLWLGNGPLIVLVSLLNLLV